MLSKLLSFARGEVRKSDNGRTATALQNRLWLLALGFQQKRKAKSGPLIGGASRVTSGQASAPVSSLVKLTAVIGRCKTTLCGSLQYSCPLWLSIRNTIYCISL